MKREIKFRGKRVDNGEWVYGWYHGNVGDENEAFIMDFEMGIPQQVMPETVGQYTGLKDRNGKDIYEGDSLQSWYSRDVSGTDIVKFDFTVEHEVNEHIGTSGFTIEFLDNAKIIGNIYTTPELLNTPPVNP